MVPPRFRVNVAAAAARKEDRAGEDVTPTRTVAFRPTGDVGSKGNGSGGGGEGTRADAASTEVLPPGEDEEEEQEEEQEVRTSLLWGFEGDAFPISPLSYAVLAGGSIARATRGGTLANMAYGYRENSFRFQ